MTPAAARLGVFGSSFNPPTLAHQVLLAEAGWQLELEKIIVVPTGDAWHKNATEAPRPAVRLELAEAAFASQDGIEVSDAEVRREGPSYTCDTLEEIQSASPDSQILFLAGADAALRIGNWHRPDRVLELAGFAVAPRPGVDLEDVARAFEEVGGSDRLEFFEMPKVEISSTLVRERVAAGRPWHHLVSTEVSEMIDNEDLYVSQQ